MFVSQDGAFGTIGGGQLEYQCTRRAVEQLDGAAVTRLERYPLGASMGQCCGGVVEVLFEPLVDGLPVWLRTLAALHGQREPAVLVTAEGANPSDRLVVTAADVFGAAEPSVIATARERLQDKKAVLDAGRFYEPVIPSDFNIAIFIGLDTKGATVPVNHSTDWGCNFGRSCKAIQIGGPITTGSSRSDSKRTDHVVAFSDSLSSFNSLS